jgi:serine/threonine-protein kinase
MGESVLFGRYRLIEPAGAGGSAQVWRATDTKTGDEVAVKRLHPIIFADEAGRARLKREFDALRSLDEPHVVRVRDLEIGDDDAALILDFVPGQSLADRLASGPPLRPDEAVAVATDVAAALAAAHATGIVHRDVTPGNILLDPSDGARLTDFGIALGGDGASAVTATGQLMGTLRYLAPEQLRGEPATAATDIHTLAAVTYEMLAGRPPYEASTPIALAEAQDAGAEALLNVAPALDNAVRRALAPDPADRPASVAAFSEELRTGLANEPTELIVGLPMEESRASDGDAQVPADKVAPGPMWPVAAATSSPARPEPGPPADDARTTPPRSLPAPLAALFALILAAIVLAALGPSDRGSPSAAGAPASVAPSPSATPPPAPAPKPKEEKGKGTGKGSGKGNH